MRSFADDYCPFHFNTQSEDLVPCPLDPSHFVLKTNLERHLLQCPSLLNKALLARTPFYKPGCNSSEPRLVQEQNAVRQVRMSSREGDDVDLLVSEWNPRIESAFARGLQLAGMSHMSTDEVLFGGPQLNQDQDDVDDVALMFLFLRP